MPRRERNASESQCATAGDLSGLVKRVSCACAQGRATRDAPLSRDLFRRVESDGESLAEAARALGLGLRDGAYLLAGLRRDVAVEFVAALLAAKAQSATGHSEGARGDPGIDTPLTPKGDAPCPDRIERRS